MLTILQFFKMLLMGAAAMMLQICIRTKDKILLKPLHEDYATSHYDRAMNGVEGIKNSLLGICFGVFVMAITNSNYIQKLHL